MLQTLKSHYKDLKKVIERTSFSLLSVYPWSRVMIAKTHMVDDNRQLWCWSEERIPNPEAASFPVTVKFIDREKGNYIRISGKAFVEKNVVTTSPVDEQEERSSFLRIEMQQVVWYFKKSGKIKFYRYRS